MKFECSDPALWATCLASYKSVISSLNKPNIISLDDFYTNELPSLLESRNPNPHITKPELVKVMQWKLTRGKHRPRLLNFISSLDETLIQSASEKAFLSLPDISKSISELTVLKGVGPATASAVLAAYSPDVAPFMSDEAMVAVLGNAKEYTLKQYVLLVEKLQAKAKELSSKGTQFTPSDIERALWSSSVGGNFIAPAVDPEPEVNSKRNSKRRRK
ncbi:hypothetical protein RJ641_032043 [Dillenia turbinata]|uniref:Uncharacterized protein n=1 Tax=Dillenia turbinata TaxID=194707 RepID=A0AAN8ZLL7_9MAGN